MSKPQIDVHAAAHGLKAGLGESWDRVSRRLRAELGEEVFTSWFARLEIDGVVGGTAQLSVPTKFLKSWIQSHYLDRMLAILSAEVEGVQGLAIGVRSSSRPPTSRPQAFEGVLGRPSAPRPAALAGETPAFSGTPFS